MSDFEREDMELEAIMGGRFHDCTKEQAQKPIEGPGWEKIVPHDYEPAKPAPSWLNKLRTTAKSTAVYAIVSIVLFWWQQTGRMDYDTAWYALLLCVGMVFFSVGRVWGCKK